VNSIFQIAAPLECVPVSRPLLAGFTSDQPPFCNQIAEHFHNETKRVYQAAEKVARTAEGL